MEFNSRKISFSAAQMGHRFENFGCEEEIAFRRGLKTCIARHSAFGTIVGAPTEYMSMRVTLLNQYLSNELEGRPFPRIVLPTYSHFRPDYKT
jgi:hypothetical protein